MANEQMDVKRPRQKVKREIKRSNIALDDYMFDRKMKSLYYGNKPKSDDLPKLLKIVRAYARWVCWQIKMLPKTLPRVPRNSAAIVKKYPVRFLVGSMLLFIAIVFVAINVSHASKKSPASQPITSGSSDAAASRIPLHQTPSFPTVLPQGKTAEDLGGFAKVSPTGSPAAYAYKDQIGGVDILVSEQELPDTMKNGTSAQVEKVAINFNATQSVKTEKSEFFIGTNSGGEQSVITYTKSLLIFLKSSAKISNERWQTYIENLK